jgi:hypothetical protein
VVDELARVDLVVLTDGDADIRMELARSGSDLAPFENESGRWQGVAGETIEVRNRG